jgi:hypothetical protein
VHATDASAIPDNWDLYRAAVVGVRFKDRVVRVEPRPLGTAAGSFPRPVGSLVVIHVITAWNPCGRTAPADANARAQLTLLGEIHRRGLAWWPAEGSDAGGTHREESVAVAGLSDTAARALGRRFGQDAVFAWTPAVLRVLACDTDAVATSGWAASAHGPRSSLRPGEGAARGASDARPGIPSDIRRTTAVVRAGVGTDGR